MKLQTLVLLLAIFSCSCHGQPTTTVSQTLVTNATGTIGPNVKNIGQPNHRFIMIMKDAVGQTCTDPDASLDDSVQASVQGSYDNSSFVNLPMTIRRALVPHNPGATRRFFYIFNAVGAMPYVRPVVTNLSVPCVIDIHYVGGYVALPDDSLFQYLDSFTDVYNASLGFGLQTTFLTGFGGTASLRSARVGATYALYSLSLTNQGAGTCTVSINYSKPGAVIPVAPIVLNGHQLAQGQSITLSMSPSNQPYGRTLTNADVQVATSGTCSLHGFFITRVE